MVQQDLISFISFSDELQKIAMTLPGSLAGAGAGALLGAGIGAATAGKDARSHGALRGAFFGASTGALSAGLKSARIRAALAQRGIHADTLKQVMKSPATKKAVVDELKRIGHEGGLSAGLGLGLSSAIGGMMGREAGRKEKQLRQLGSS